MTLTTSIIRTEAGDRAPERSKRRKKAPFTFFKPEEIYLVDKLMQDGLSGPAIAQVLNKKFKTAHDKKRVSSLLHRVKHRTGDAKKYYDEQISLGRMKCAVQVLDEPRKEPDHIMNKNSDISAVDLDFSAIPGRKARFSAEFTFEVEEELDDFDTSTIYSMLQALPKSFAKAIFEKLKKKVVII